MQTIDQYLDEAKRRAGIDSDRDLGLALGLKPNSPTNYRTKRAWPSDDVMVRLAQLAGVDPATALMDLNAWRAHGQAKEIYQRIAAKIAATAAAVMLIFGATAPARAENAGGTLHHQIAPSIYYATLRRWLAQLTGIAPRLAFA